MENSQLEDDLKDINSELPHNQKDLKEDINNFLDNQTNKVTRLDLVQGFTGGKLAEELTWTGAVNNDGTCVVLYCSDYY